MQVLTYGVPSASVLLLELLRQSHEPAPHAVPLPRAELIRNLSVFISYRGLLAPATATTTPAKKPRKNCLASLTSYSIQNLCSSMWWTMLQQASTTS